MIYIEESWWLQIQRFPKFTFRFNNSLERQNSLKTIILTITFFFLPGKDTNLNQPKEETYRIKSRRGPNSSCPFQLFTPFGVMDSYLFLAIVYTQYCRSGKLTHVLVSKFSLKFYCLAWLILCLDGWILQPFPSENWLTSGYRGSSSVIC